MASKKKLSAIAAVVLIAALLLTGTFAWSRIRSEVNDFEGKPYGAELIDQYDPDGDGDKNVGAHNTGQVGLYVRMALDQWMEIFDDELEAYKDLMGSQNAVDRDANPAGQPGDNWWSHNYDIDPATGDPGDLFNTYWEWVMGGNDPTYPGTIPGVVYTYTEWKDEGEPADVWVYCSDGYFYWSSVLAPGAYTGQLLDRVIGDAALEDMGYYYAINAILEVVDGKDLKCWLEGGTTTKGDEFEQVPFDAEDVLVGARGPVEAIYIVLTGTQPTVFDEGDEFTSAGLQVKVVYSDGSTKIISDGFTTDPDEDEILATPGTQTVTVAYEGKTATYQIKVNKKGVFKPVWGEPAAWSSTNWKDGVTIDVVYGDNDASWVLHPNPQGASLSTHTGLGEAPISILLNDLFVQQGLTSSEVTVDIADAGDCDGVNGRGLYAAGTNEGGLRAWIDGNRFRISYVPTLAQITGNMAPAASGGCSLVIPVVVSFTINSGAPVNFTVNMRFAGMFPIV